MKQYFLGVDVGSSKTEAAVADEYGNILGTGLSGAGNHETVGYDGLTGAISESVSKRKVFSCSCKRSLALFEFHTI